MKTRLRWQIVFHIPLKPMTHSPQMERSRYPGENTTDGGHVSRAAKQQVELVALFFGRTHTQGRLDVAPIFHQLYEAQPGVRPLHFLISAWGSANYRYISEVMDGTRRLLRMLPDKPRKAEYRREALSPRVHGQPRLAFPITWLMGHHTGYWKPIAAPKMEERIPKSAWKAFLRQPVKPLRAAGEPPPELAAKDKMAAYPAGTPLRLGEIQRARGSRPRSTDGGTFDGITPPIMVAGTPSFARQGEREVIK